MKTWNKTISLLCNDEPQIVTNGYPDLRINGVLECSIKGLNMQMLFDPFEEQLNLPTFTVQFRNGQGGLQSRSCWSGSDRPCLLQSLHTQQV